MESNNHENSLEPNEATNENSMENENNSVEQPKKKKRNFLKLGLGILLGAGIGFGYYALVGCQTGHCPITSNPLISTAYGGVIGGLIAGM